MPKVSRVLALSTLMVTIPCALQIVSPYQMALLWPYVMKRWQLWRIVTGFFYAGGGWTMLFNSVFMYNASTKIEAFGYFNDAIDYSWSLMGMACIILAQWSVYLPEAPVSLMGLFSIPGKYLAFTMLGIDLLVGGPDMMLVSLTGTVAGYAWYFGRDAPRFSRRYPRLRWLAWFARYLSPVFQTPRVVRSWADGSLRIRQTSHALFNRPQRTADGRANKTSATSIKPDRAAILAATEARMRSKN